MSARLTATFEARARAGQKVLVAYLCVGDPDEEESIALARAAVDAGADVLELGVPFSDPTADGPAIQRASQRALARGGGFAQTLRVARAVRDAVAAPIVLFGYYNPIFVRGERAATVEAHAAGVDAFLVVDLPLEEQGPLRAEAKARGLAVVPLLAPTSSPARAEAVRTASAAGPSGFLYYVSVAGVTGHAAAPLAEASANAARLGAATGLPAVVGFGVDGPERAREAASAAAGVVVGTWLVRSVEEAQSPEARRNGVADRVRALRTGLDSPEKPATPSR